MNSRILIISFKAVLPLVLTRSSFSALRQNVFFARASDFSWTSLYLRRTSLSHLSVRTQMRRAPSFSFLRVYTPRDADTWGGESQSMPVIDYDTRTGGRKCHGTTDEGTSPTNRATDWLTDWRGSLSSRYRAKKKCANNAGVNKDPRRRIRYCRRSDSR